MTTTQYTPDYFIKKFSAIPDEKWITDSFSKDGKCCALGHCGWGNLLDDVPYDEREKAKAEGRALSRLFYTYIDASVTVVNDGRGTFKQATPRERILAALREIAKKFYTVDYFIAKFEAIPNEKWTTGLYVDRWGQASCALGHCGVRAHEVDIAVPQEAIQLRNLFERHPRCLSVTDVNDRNDPNFQQETPKARILAALREIKAVTHNSK
jgi:hypothetical protein